MTPKLSVLLPAMRGYDSVLAALDSWQSQTCVEQLEILVLCPGQPGPSSRPAEARRPGEVIVHVGGADLHEARAIGAQRATGDYVVLAEDHCLPDPDWAQAIVERLGEGWDAVGSGPSSGRSVQLLDRRFVPDRLRRVDDTGRRWADRRSVRLERNDSHPVVTAARVPSWRTSSSWVRFWSAV